MTVSESCQNGWKEESYPNSASNIKYANPNWLTAVPTAITSKP